MITSITVTYNPDINILSDQLIQLSKQVDNIFLVDNFSKNFEKIKETIQCLKLQCDCNFIMIFLNENLGLAKAQNIGIQEAIKANFDYVLLFDQDSVPSSNFADLMRDELIKLEKEGEKVAAVGPFYLDPKSNEIYPATVYKGPFIQRVKPQSAPVEVTFIIASGSLIPLKHLQKIGLMKEDFFIDYIDVEWCLRAKSQGYKCYMLPSVNMKHSIGDNRINFLGRSISIHSPLRRYYLMRNSFIISRLKYIPFGYKVREFFFNFVRFCVFIIVSPDKKNVWKCSVAGFKDGVLGKTGKKSDI